MKRNENKKKTYFCSSHIDLFCFINTHMLEAKIYQVSSNNKGFTAVRKDTHQITINSTKFKVSAADKWKSRYESCMKKSKERKKGESDQPNRTELAAKGQVVVAAEGNWNLGISQFHHHFMSFKWTSRAAFVVHVFFSTHTLPDKTGFCLSLSLLTILLQNKFSRERWKEIVLFFSPESDSSTSTWKPNK